MNICSGPTWTKTTPGETDKSVPSTLEVLPNELFLDIFTYLDIEHLYNAFWGLNGRLNHLFQSYENLYLTFGEKTNPWPMKSYAHFITRLTIDTPKICDLTQFPNLQTLVLCDIVTQNICNKFSRILFPNYFVYLFYWDPDLLHPRNRLIMYSPTNFHLFVTLVFRELMIS